MKKLSLLLAICPFVVFSQSDNGKGNINSVQISEISDSQMTLDLNILNYTGEKTKFKKGKISKLFQWFDYENEWEQLRRIRREYAGGFMYDEEMVVILQAASAEIRITVRYSGKGITLQEEADEDDNYFVYERLSKVYDEGILQATLYFIRGRTYKILHQSLLHQWTATICKRNNQ